MKQAAGTCGAVHAATGAKHSGGHGRKPAEHHGRDRVDAVQ